MTDMNEKAIQRAVMALLGGLAGMALWGLVEILPDRIENERVLLGIAAAAGAFFVSLLAMAGPLGPRWAVALAPLVAIPATLLLLWGSFRFDEVGPYMESGQPVFAFSALVFIPLPYLIAWRMAPDWRDYQTLFNESWSIVVRFVVAWTFVGLFWAVLFFSDALLQIVGLEIIEDLLDIEPVPYIMTGMMLGLALAVVNEMSDYVSPFLAIRLLRLLLPFVLVVLAIFVAALPFRGLSGLFGGLSAAGTLMAAAVGAVTLVTSALDAWDEEATESPLMKLAAQAMALMIPVLTLLAFWAVALRVQQYGWTPTRVAAATAAGILSLYAVAYAGSVVMRTDWMGRIRRANGVLALVLLSVAALWLTPAINAQWLSAASQLSRLERGAVSVDEVDLWSIGREWGRAGKAALARMENMDLDDSERLKERLALLEASSSRWEFESGRGGTRDATIDEFISKLVVRPEGIALEASMFATGYGMVDGWVQSCDRRTPEGNPGCLALVVDLLPKSPGDEVLLFTQVYGDRVSVQAFTSRNRETLDLASVISGTWGGFQDPSLIDRLHAGDFRVGAPTARAIFSGDVELSITP
ncbi:MAG: DUF4153 domain-containing protein [Rhodobacteraceae bacterium]|nr:DUF4153 domain-containing protein [Paracoccaceae bacterium]